MAGDFDGLYQRYGCAVRRYLARLTGDPSLAEELCQETFFRLLRAGDSIRNRNGALGPWLFKVATNLARDDARQNRKPVVPLDTEPEAPGASATDRAETHDLDRRIREEVARLPEELRAAFLLRAHQGLTYPKLAEALEVCERTAKERFRKARSILAHRLAPLLREENR